MAMTFPPTCATTFSRPDLPTWGIPCAFAPSDFLILDDGFCRQNKTPCDVVSRTEAAATTILLTAQQRS